MDCVICGCAKNVAKHISSVLNNINIIRKLFNNTRVVFFYDKSSDDTLDYLEKYDCVVLKNTEPILEKRTWRIAYARNKLLTYVYSKHSDSQYFIMMDCDDVTAGQVHIDYLKSCLNKNNLWDGLSFNKKWYYDFWALLFEPYIQHCKSFEFYSANYQTAMSRDLRRKLNNVKGKDNEFVDVYSAFNGFAIYKTNKFINCKYDGEKQFQFTQDDLRTNLDKLSKCRIDPRIIDDVCQYDDSYNLFPGEVCEHINFHLEAIRFNQAKICVSPLCIFD